MKFIKYRTLAKEGYLPTLLVIMLLALPQLGCLGGGAARTAEKHIEAKDYRRAVEVYQSIVDASPGTTEAREAQLAIGKLSLERLNQAAAGINAYETIISDSAESDEAAEAHYRLGMHYYREKDFKAAQTRFDKIVNQFPQLELSHNAQLMLAKSYEESQEFEQAIEVFDNFANRNPRSERAAQAIANKARIQKQHLKNEDEAKRTYQSLVKKYGKVEGTEKEIEKAKQELTALKATIPVPDDPLATQLGRQLAQQDKRRERDRPRGGVERSRAMGNTNIQIADSGFGVSPSQVMRNFGGQNAIAGDEQGSYHAAELMIANFFYGDENYRDAGALYFDAIERAKANKEKIDPYSYLKLSVCYRKVGMHQRAKEVLKKAATRDKGVIDAIISTGRNQYAIEEYEKAIETYNSVVGFNRNKDSELYWLIGLAYKRLGQPEGEREAFERSVAANTENMEALQALAEVLNYRLKEQKLAGIYQDIIDGKPDSYIGAKTIGELCDKYGNYTHAKSKYRAAARTAKRLLGKSESKAEKRVLTNQIVHGTILAARATFHMSGAEDAQLLIDELVTEYPEHALIPYGKGELALLRGDDEAAVAAFKEAIEKDALADIPIIALGDYYVSQGYNDDAIALWKGFLEANRYNQKVRRRLNNLR